MPRFAMAYLCLGTLLWVSCLDGASAKHADRFLTWTQAKEKCFQLVHSAHDVFLSVRAEDQPYPKCEAIAMETFLFAASFKVVKALTNHKKGFSLESCRHAGHYLRHNNHILVVEPPKAPSDAVWTIDDGNEACLTLRSINLRRVTLQIDSSPGSVGMRPVPRTGLACLRMKEVPSESSIPESKCKANNVSDAVKVVSMADGEPCRLIPFKKCSQELPGSVLGEHALCKTEAIARDLKAKECLVYGIGISDNWDFEKFMAQKGCEVHAFDPTIAKPPSDESKRLPNLHFHRWGLAGKSKETGSHKVAGTLSGATETSQPMLTVSDIMERLGHSQRRLSVFKIDCEGCEWAAMAAFPDELWGRIDQLSLELHYGKELMLDSKAQLKRAARVTDMLRAHGFTEWRSDWRDGYESHRQLLPELYEVGMPRNLCCRLSGFVRTEKTSVTQDRDAPFKELDAMLKPEDIAAPAKRRRRRAAKSRRRRAATRRRRAAKQ